MIRSALAILAAMFLLRDASAPDKPNLLSANWVHGTARAALSASKEGQP